MKVGAVRIPEPRALLSEAAEHMIDNRIHDCGVGEGIGGFSVIGLASCSRASWAASSGMTSLVQYRLVSAVTVVHASRVSAS